jgi:two-component system chemotaxis sensor kinase CheA
VTGDDSNRLAEQVRRAEAAEKTVEVLKRKVLALYDGTGKVAIQKQLDHLQRRSDAIQRRRELSELRAAELERHSKELEAEVAERTRTIRTILDNVTFGFLLVDPAMVVCDGASKSCLSLFGLPQITGKKLAELLCVNEREQDILETALGQAFEDLLPEELTLSQTPSRFRVGEKTLALEYRLVRADDGSPVQILVTISDATRLAAAEREAQMNRVIVAIYKQRDAFRGFIADSMAELEAAKANVEDQVFVRRTVHTIKGNAGCYGVIDLMEAAHAVEDAPEIDLAQLSRLEGALRHFLDEHRELLGIDLEGGYVFEVSERRARAFRDMTDRESVAPGIRRWAAELSLKSMADLLGPVDVMVERLAARLDRKVALELGGSEILLDAVSLTPVVAVLGHLLRNSVCHGIEAPELRGNKPETGCISLETREMTDEWQIEVYDDGAGIDVERVVARAIELGIVTREQAGALDHESKLQLIFKDRVSTASEVTVASGRGVGMSSVLSAVQHAGGHVEVATQRGRFTRITLHLPKPEFLRQPAQGGFAFAAEG